MQALVDAAKKIYITAYGTKQPGDPNKVASAARQVLPNEARDYIDLIAEDVTLLTEMSLLRLAPGSAAGVSPLEMVEQRVFERISKALHTWLGTTDTEWQCQRCGKKNIARETCAVCWSARM
jgi:hypothetical protein